MPADLVDALIRATVGGSLAILLVLALRKPARRLLGARLAYRLWVLVPLAVIGSLLPAPTIDIYASAPAGLEPALDAVSGLAAGASWPWVLTLWSAGVIASLGVMAVRQHRFLRTLGTPSLDEDGLPLLHALDGSGIGPAVVGAFNPKIVLPANFATRYSEAERRLVLAHERAHLFAHDAQVNALAALLLCLNWFNPLVHLASRLMRIDQEMAADAMVVAQFPQGQRLYAEAILKTQMAALSLPLGCQWPTRAGHPLRERIALLSRAASGPIRRRLGAAAVVLLGLGAGFSAWAAQPPSGLFAAGDRGRVIEVWAVLKSPVAGAGKASHLYVSSGKPITRAYRLPDGTPVSVTMTPRLDGAAVALGVEVRSADAVLARSQYLLHDGEPAVVRLNQAAVVITARSRNGFWPAGR